MARRSIMQYILLIISIYVLAAVANNIPPPPAPCVELAPNVCMPKVNLGLCNHDIWLKNGGRGVDTAFVYGDKAQKETGESIRNSNIPRSELFVTTKVPCCPAKKWLKFAGGVGGCAILGHNTSKHIEHDMSTLDLEYVDLMLLHWPCDTFEETLSAYSAMEEMVAKGTARAIGVSNFNSSMIERIVKEAKIKPAINQCGFSIADHTNDTWGRDDLTVSTCKKHGITYEAYSPLGGWAKGGTSHVLDDPTVMEIAKKHNKTAAQIALRWVVQQDIVLVTASNNIEHEIGDLEIFNWTLSLEEMEQLAALQL